MSSNRFADSGAFTAAELAGTLEFRPRSSKQLGRFLVVIHVAAALTVLYAVHDKLDVTALLGLILLSYYRVYRRHILQLSSRSTRRVVCQDDGVWFLQDLQGVIREARLLPSTYVHARLVILNFELVRSSGRRSLVLCPDSVDGQTLRQLRARLRIATQSPPAESFNEA